MRIGIGYDVHQLCEGRRLILGGVEIPFERGLLGHSDADVLIHAIMDAILGAMGKGDIGRHFPDTDPAYSGISSVELLKQIVRLMKENRYRIGNVDAVVIAQRPKIGPYFPAMQRILAETMECAPEQINLKATTEERLGFTGREEGMAAEAVCLLEPMVQQPE